MQKIAFFQVHPAEAYLRRWKVNGGQVPVPPLCSSQPPRSPVRPASNRRFERPEIAEQRRGTGTPSVAQSCVAIVGCARFSRMNLFSTTCHHTICDDKSLPRNDLKTISMWRRVAVVGRHFVQHDGTYPAPVSHRDIWLSRQPRAWRVSNRTADCGQPATATKNAAEALGDQPGPTAAPARRGRQWACKRRRRDVVATRAAVC